VINGDFTQQVTLDGANVYTTGVSVNESYSGIVSSISFRLHAEVNPGIESILRLGAEIRVTQSDGFQTLTHVAEISRITNSRVVDADAYDIECLGEADKLSRRRGTKLYPPTQTASQVVTSLMADFADGLGITTSGVDNNTQSLGGLELRQESPLDAFAKIARRTGWAFQVVEGDLKFFDPLTFPGPFNIRSLQNLEKSTLQLSEDAAGLTNILRAEAYEYVKVSTTKIADGCATSSYATPMRGSWEISEQPVIISPDRLKGFPGSIDPITGKIEFSQPLGSESGSVFDKFNITTEFEARRKVIVEVRDEASISEYGERVGAFRSGNGGDDIDTTITKLRADVQRRAFPVISGSCRVTRLGLRPGMSLAVLPIGAIQPRTVIIESVNTSVSGADCQVSIAFSSRSYFIAENVIDILERVENLEKSDLHSRSVTGKVIDLIQPIRDTPTIAPEVLTVSSTTLAIVAVLGTFSGGGGVDLTTKEIQLAGLAITGGGKLKAATLQFPVYTLGMTGGGRFLFTSEKIVGPVVELSVTGGGRFLYTASKLEGVRINQNTTVV